MSVCMYVNVNVRMYVCMYVHLEKKRTNAHNWRFKSRKLMYVCDTTESYLWHLSFIRVTRLIHIRGSTHLHVWHDSFTCATWRIHICDMTHSCGMTHSYVWHDLSIHSQPTPALSRCMNESCHTYEWVMSRIWMSRVTHMNESCHTRECVTSHKWMSHVTHTNESCHTYESVMSHIWMSHATHMNETCHTYEWVMSNIISHVASLAGYGGGGIVLQCAAVCCIVSQCAALCRSVLQCAAVCCSVLQCVAGLLRWRTSKGHVTSYINESIIESHINDAHQWVMSVQHINESHL